MTVAAVTAEDVESFMHAVAAGKTARKSKTKPRGLSIVRGGRGAATRTVGLLGAIFTYAIRKKLRADNPVRGVIRFADGRVESYAYRDDVDEVHDLAKSDSVVARIAQARLRKAMITHGLRP